MKSNIKTDYNIEFAHIYADTIFGREQLSSINVFNRLAKRLSRDNKSYVSSVMIDEYSPDFKILNEQKYFAKLKELNASPDYLAYESHLKDIAWRIISLMSGKSGREYKKYVNQKNKLPCSLLVAAWYLLRLGLIDSTDKVYKRVSNTSRPFYASKIINILPKKYIGVEKKAIAIIKATRFKDIIHDIKYIYF